MAKGKHSAALFEVIHSGKRTERSAAGLLRTPKWWFKGRARGTGLPSAAPAEFVPESSVRPASASEPPKAAEAEIRQEARPQRKLGGGRMPFEFALDRDLHELTLKLRYTTAIVAGFAVFVVIALAYITGRHLGRGPQASYAGPTSSQIRTGRVTPGALEVGRSSRPAAPSVEVPATPAGNDAVKPVTQTPPEPAAVEGTNQRIIGMNYVIVQAYPDRKVAEKAAEMLTRSSIPCTVEPAPGPQWHKEWAHVIGTTGFRSVLRNPQYDEYVAAIRTVGDKFAAGTRFNKFEPTAIKWK